jgi:peptidoglycan/LPS O-acetylase OafA/YrhL
VKQSNPNYQPALDGLRAIAVIAVIAFHFGFLKASGGYVGVDIFFALSGYLITRLLLREIEKTETLDLWAFYGRRIRRLMPALLVLIITVLIVWEWVMPGQIIEITRLAQSADYSILGFGNLYFLKRSRSYFDPNTTLQPLLHLWSLGVEEQFYLFWPLLILFIAKISQRSKIEFRRLCFWTLLFISFVSFAFAVHSMKIADHYRAFFIAPLRSWELAVGGCLALIPTQLKTWFKRPVVAETFTLLGLTLIAFAVFRYNKSTPFPGVRALVPVMGTLLVIAAIEHSFVNRILSLKPLVFIGTISYGWYLWHWPFLTIVKNWSFKSERSLKIQLVLLVGSFIAACLSYFLVEKPIRNGFHSLAKPKMALFAYLSGWLVIFGLGQLLIHVDQRNAAAKYGSEATAMFLKIGERSSLYEECFVHPKSFSKLAPCISSGKDSDPIIAVMGNSHADAFYSMAERYAKNHQAKAALYSRVRYVLPGITYPKLKPKVRKFDHNALEELQSRVTEDSNRKISVILASRFFSLLTKIPKKENRIIAFKQSVEKLRQIGIYRILIMLPFPQFEKSSGRCYQRNLANLSLCKASRSTLEIQRHEFVDIIQTVASQFDNVRAIDPYNAICDAESCPQFFMKDGKMLPATYDDGHPSVSVSNELADFFKSDLDWLINRN